MKRPTETCTVRGQEIQQRGFVAHRDEGRKQKKGTVHERGGREEVARNGGMTGTR